MKRTTMQLLTIFAVAIISCKSDDDTTIETPSNNILVGTTWDGQETVDGIYSFSSNTEFRFVDHGEAPVDGTYTFNGTNGVLT